MGEPEESNRPIKVLWLIKGLGPGGAEQLLLLSAKVADHAAFEYQVAFFRPDKTHLIPEFEQYQVTPQRLGAKRPGRLGWVADLRQLLGEADVVHAHSPLLASVARLLILTLPRRHRPKMLSTEHNQWSSHRRPTRIANGLTSLLDSYNWAVSDPVKESIWGWRRASFHVLIHGIDTQAPGPGPEARSQARAALGIADDEVLCITVANLRRHKDYPNLLRTAKIARAAEPRLRFIAVGQGPLADEISALHEELGLGDGLQLLGYRRDVPDLMAAADVFVMSSIHEGLPVAIMEAFATGLPVVATTVGGVPQAVTDGVEGRLVPPNDSEALARAVVEVARDDNARREMGAAAKRRSADYDIRSAMGVQQAKYRELAGPGR